MEALARDGKIDHIEFHNEDGNWWGEIVWMYNDGHVGVLAKNISDPNYSSAETVAFVLKCEPVNLFEGIMYCDAVVQQVLGNWQEDTYTEDPGNKPMHTQIQIVLKHEIGLWILFGVLFGFAVYKKLF